jgi:uncharacterized protein (DUF427 family)
MGVSTMANKAPGFARNPDKRIGLKREGRRVRVEIGGVTVADSTDTITMYESGGYAPVHYFPAADVHRELLTRTDKSTHCPYKGQASYWTIEAGGKQQDNAAWSYETPYDEMSELAGRFAFYADKVDAIEVD